MNVPGRKCCQGRDYCDGSNCPHPPLAGLGRSHGSWGQPFPSAAAMVTAPYPSSVYPRQGEPQPYPWFGPLTTPLLMPVSCPPCPPDAPIQTCPACPPPPAPAQPCNIQVSCPQGQPTSVTAGIVTPGVAFAGLGQNPTAPPWTGGRPILDTGCCSNCTQIPCDCHSGGGGRRRRCPFCPPYGGAYVPPFAYSPYSQVPPNPCLNVVIPPELKAYCKNTGIPGIVSPKCPDGFEPMAAPPCLACCVPKKTAPDCAKAPMPEAPWSSCKLAPGKPVCLGKKTVTSKDGCWNCCVPATAGPVVGPGVPAGGGSGGGGKKTAAPGPIAGLGNAFGSYSRMRNR